VEGGLKGRSSRNKIGVCLGAPQPVVTINDLYQSIRAAGARINDLYQGIRAAGARINDLYQGIRAAGARINDLYQGTPSGVPQQPREQTRL
jgi:hypothetical protein